MPESDIASAPDAKIALRKRALLAARASSAAYGDEAGERVAKAFLGAIALPSESVVSGYAPLKSEIDPMPLLRRLAQRGHVVTLPFIEAPGKPLRFKRWRPGDPLVSGQFGARHPAGDVDFLDPDLLVIPLLAFDSDGYRLGRGGGFYDRTIAELKARKPVQTVGLAFSAQLILKVPRESHDERLDWIVTEEGALSCA